MYVTLGIVVFHVSCKSALQAPIPYRATVTKQVEIVQVEAYVTTLTECVSVFLDLLVLDVKNYQPLYDGK